MVQDQPRLADQQHPDRADAARGHHRTIGGASLPELIVSALIVLGGAFALIGRLGLVRLPSLMERLHGPTKATSIPDRQSL